MTKKPPKVQFPTSRFGQVLSADDATVASMPNILQQDDMLPKAGIDDTGNALWSYRNEHKINGYVVDEPYRDLKIDRDDMLSVAFRPEIKPHSVLFRLCPENKEDNEAYEKLLQGTTDGTIDIVDETCQFDAAKSCYLVWVRYKEVKYVLHPRFNYLLEE